jgi:uncharacterized protein (DUF58 family)
MSGAAIEHVSWGAWLRTRLRAAISYDVFPDFSAKVRRLLYNPLGVLLMAALAAFLCGLFLHSQGFVLFGSLLAVILLGIVWPWITLRGLRGAVAFDRPRISEGQTSDVCLTLQCRLLWSALGLSVRGGLTAAGSEGQPAATIAAAPRRRIIRCRWAFTPPCRGVYPRTPLRLTTGFP